MPSLRPSAAVQRRLTTISASELISPSRLVSITRKPSNGLSQPVCSRKPSPSRSNSAPEAPAPRVTTPSWSRSKAISGVLNAMLALPSAAGVAGVPAGRAIVATDVGSAGPAASRGVRPFSR